MKRIALFVGLAVLLLGCSKQKSQTLGTKFDGVPIPVSKAREAAPETVIILHGTMTKKCPVAGCWFFLQDDTGTIKVDTKNSGFVVVDVPLNSTLTVAGRIGTNEAGRFLDATGLRY